MQELSETCYGNILCVQFKVDADKNECSREYFINHCASFQVQHMNKAIYIKFAKLHEEDPLNYTIELKYVINIVYRPYELEDKKSFNGYKKWHMLDGPNLQICTSLKLTVELEALPITNSFASLHADTELTDFVLRGEDGSVEIHKVVLAALSPVFRKMVSGNWQEAKEGHVDIKGTSKTTLNHLKDYVYLNTLPDTGLEQLLLLASCYMMPDLEQKCVDKLMRNITADNVSELLKFAVQHELTRLWLSMLGSCPNGVIDEIWGKHMANNTNTKLP